MYIIKIKSRDLPLEVEDASNLKMSWVEYTNAPFGKKINKALSIQNWTGTLSDIKSIELLKEGQSKTNNSFKDWLEMKRQKVNNTPQEKSRVGGFLRLFHYLVSGRKLENEPEEFMDTFNKITLDFFIENPKRIYPDLIIYKPLYKSSNISIMNMTGLEVLNHQINQDIKYS
ncbi:MAG: hypothetical protein WC055_14670 [Melioribacteraceae bacterium]